MGIVSEVVSDDLRCRRLNPEGVTYALPDLTKETRAGQNLKTSFHASFEETPNPCVVKYLKVYEHSNSELRPLDLSKPNKLLFSYIRPHKPISGASLSRWLKDIISRAGIDASMFKLTQYEERLHQLPIKGVLLCSISQIVLVGQLIPR